MTSLTNTTPEVIELEELADDGTLLGRSVLEPTGHVAWLGLEVAPEARGRHLGRRLLARSLAAARDHDIAVVCVSFRRGDPAALQLIRTCRPPAHVHAAGASCIAQIATDPLTGDPNVTLDLG